MARQEDTLKHGSANTYTNHGCRCDECKAAKSAAHLAYNEKNREREAERAKRWYAENRERAKRRIKEWQKANPDKVRAAKRTGIAKARLVEGAQFESGIDYESLWTGSCGICAGPMDRSIPRHNWDTPTIDHIMPLSKGGSHVIENLQWAHMACNSGKGAKHGR